MNPDKVLMRHKSERHNLKIWVEDDYVFVEGNKETLSFLSDIIRAQSEFDDDCGFQISPKGRGKRIFEQKSKLGIYIHRLPCKEGRHK